MSYATSKENNENTFNLSEEFLNRTRMNLNESLDTKEWLLPERRRANKDEAALVSRQILSLDLYGDISTETSLYFQWCRNLMSSWYFIKDKGFTLMQNVLQDRFIAGWENMNLMECVFGSIELYIRISRDSSHTRSKEKWGPSIQILLKQKLIASKRALHNLDRVHDAYHNVRPLLNSTVTPNGSYDTIYFTKELFKESTQINKTYTRVRRHITTNINNIDGLFRIYSADYHENETVAKRFRYSNAFLRASFEYVNDLKLYESLVIEDPLKRITKAKKSVVNNDLLFNSWTFSTYTTERAKYHMAWNMAILYLHIREANRLIVSYLHTLNSTRKTSKLAHAIRMISSAHSWTRETDKYIYYARNYLQGHNLFGEVANLYTRSIYRFVMIAMSEPLMRAFVVKLSDHYEQSSWTEKAAMSRYFDFRMNSSLLAKLIHGERTDEYSEGIRVREMPFAMDNITRAVTDIKSCSNNLEYLLGMTRLTGTFFR